MTTKTKTQTAEQAPADDLDAETEAVLAEWKQKKDDDRLQRARIVAERRLIDRRRAEAAKQPGYWAPRLARQGMVAVTAAPGWEECPVPETSASGVDFADRPKPTEPGRPVAYCATVWTLDERGIHRGTPGYWICSPVFQTQRGNGVPDRYAVLADGAWRIVDGPDRSEFAGPDAATQLLAETVKRLTAAGLVLNRQPLDVIHDRVPVSTMDFQPAQIAVYRRSGHITGSPATRQLALFLDTHKTEAWIREGNHR